MPVAAIAVDFSDARPTIMALKDAGVVAVIRYLTGSGKAITKAELQSYLEAGIVVVFVFEVAANDVAGGFAAGALHAKQALAALATLGITGCPIYFACDEDVTASSALAYFQGVNSVLPASLTGAYGEGSLLVLLHNDGLTTFHWLSESTGFPGYQEAMDAGIVNLQQVYNGSPVPGTDKDTILKSDIGQWPRPVPPPAPTPTTTISPRGDDMLHTISIPTDANGNGYQETTIPWANFMAISVEGSDPAPAADDRYFGGTPGVQDRDGVVLAQVRGYLPDSVANVFILATA